VNAEGGDEGVDLEKKRKPVTSYLWFHKPPQFKSTLTNAGWHPEKTTLLM